MNEASKQNYLKDEYLLLQKFYEDFDGRIMTIKGWSASIAIAAIGVGFYQDRRLWLFASAASAVFWTLESLWKSFQYRYAPRIQTIELAFRDDDFDAIAPFQIYDAWFVDLKKRGFQLARISMMPIVFFPHLLTLVSGLLLFLFMGQDR
jgi:hypothetical protein